MSKTNLNLGIIKINHSSLEHIEELIPNNIAVIEGGISWKFLMNIYLKLNQGIIYYLHSYLV